MVFLFYINNIKKLKETVIFEENSRKYASWNEDKIILTKTSQIDSTAKEVKYHGWSRAKCWQKLPNKYLYLRARTKTFDELTKDYLL